MMRNFPAQALLLKNWSLYVSLFRTCHPPWIITNPDEGPCCEMVKKKPPACRLPTKFAEKNQNAKRKKFSGGEKNGPQVFCHLFFLVAKSFARKKLFAIFSCFLPGKSGQCNMWTMNVKIMWSPKASFLRRHLSNPGSSPWQNFWPDRTAGCQFSGPLKVQSSKKQPWNFWPDTTGGASSFPEAPHCCFPTGTLVPKRSMWMSLAEKSLQAAAGKCQQIHRKSDT